MQSAKIMSDMFDQTKVGNQMKRVVFGFHVCQHFTWIDTKRSWSNELKGVIGY